MQPPETITGFNKKSLQNRPKSQINSYLCPAKIHHIMPENVFGIKCEACGSPLSFDIIKQNYKCEACGCESPVERVTQKLRDESKKRSENQRLTLENKPRSIFQCTSCGARIFVPEGEALAKCDFCETSALKSDFADMVRRQNLLVSLNNGFWEEGGGVILLFGLIAHAIILPMIYTAFLK